MQLQQNNNTINEVWNLTLSTNKIIGQESVWTNID